jgi:cytoskeletal protein CcmA (bactofilin family)
MVVIGNRVVIKATIEAGTVVCKGRLQGYVVAPQKRSSCLLQEPLMGNLSTARLSVETGDVINGCVSMGSPK